MKNNFRALSVALAAVLAVSVLSGCSSDSADDKTIVVGASPTPHAEILEVAKEVLAEKGYTLEIKEFTDYVQPNLTLENKELDANYFQHKPYLDDFNVEHKTSLVSVAAIHYEPLGVYGGKTKSLGSIPDKAVILVPNDTTNEARALLLLESLNIIKLKANAGLKATVKDIESNPHNVQVKELEAAQITRSLPDADFAVINGNYAIDAGLNVSTDALAKEEKDSEAAQTYANIIAVRKGDENREDIKALIDALKSDTVREFIESNYKGAVLPV